MFKCGPRLAFDSIQNMDNDHILADRRPVVARERRLPTLPTPAALSARHIIPRNISQIPPVMQDTLRLMIASPTTSYTARLTAPTYLTIIHLTLGFDTS
ncbi:hypothetical protein BST61_g5985 [Cercospora zeina]